MTRTSQDSAPATKTDIAELRQMLDRIGLKLNEHDQRFDAIDRKLEEHDKRFDLFDAQFHRILEFLYGDANDAKNGATIIGLHGRVNRLERYLGLSV